MQVVSVWNVGVEIAAAPNMVATGFLQKMLHQDLAWVLWLAAAPFSIAMSIGLYYVRMMPPETEIMPGGYGGGGEGARGAGADERPLEAPAGGVVGAALLLDDGGHPIPIRQFTTNDRGGGVVVIAGHWRDDAWKEA